MAHNLRLNRLDDFLAAICRNRTVFALEKAKKRYHLVRSDRWEPDRFTIGAFRPIEPLKSLVFRPRESVGSDVPATQERIAIGVKNCDLSALRIHDHVFLKSEPVDPYYAEAREKTIIVSCDCSEPCDVCFCTAVDEQPYAAGGFDINLSPTPYGFVVETGSERGETLLQVGKQFLEPIRDDILKERDKNREQMSKRVAAQNGLKTGSDLQKAIQESAESDLWDRFAENCVECGACNFVCCTCHCFLLADGMSKDKVPARVKQWDSCLYKNFARVAGGANPRSHRAERLYNRFDKKFNFFPQVLDTYACGGCGRCIGACAGKIDVRDVLKEALG